MIGILGGMGPEAGAYTYMRMIRYCQEKYGAKYDSDFPPIIMYSLPLPDVVEQKCNEEKVLALLGQGIETLQKAGADFSIIACNTVQCFVPKLQKKGKVLSLVEETLREAESSGIEKWGLLGSNMTMQKGLYQNAFAQANLSVVEPDSEKQKIVTSAIMDILSGNRNEEAREKLMDVVSWLKGKEAQGIILACTDLPIVISSESIGIKTLDTSDVIAKAAIEYYNKIRGE
jgi:aspartate racemase